MAGTVVLALEVSALDADLAAVDALARLALLARQRGCELRLLGVGGELRELIELAGLADLLLGPDRL